MVLMDPFHPVLQVRVRRANGTNFSFLLGKAVVLKRIPFPSKLETSDLISRWRRLQCNRLNGAERKRVRNAERTEQKIRSPGRVSLLMHWQLGA
ncbi:Uncharacterized protein DAT39_019321 [Clarias magur]|uniref:Uncharacterized protein n=1 Tax=Clarias magur TaxID=1594786 RepID=A0A8J4T8Q7_CLAMG|nr:Uncharacterized protein DAT39_019321 [Clarias magur]